MEEDLTQLDAKSVEETIERSWWVTTPENFKAALTTANVRMRLELPDKHVQKALDAALWIEEQENLGNVIRGEN
jgi:hypothetical protein